MRAVPLARDILGHGKIGRALDEPMSCMPLPECCKDNGNTGENGVDGDQMKLKLTLQRPEFVFVLAQSLKPTAGKPGAFQGSLISARPPFGSSSFNKASNSHRSHNNALDSCLRLG